MSNTKAKAVEEKARELAVAVESFDNEDYNSREAQRFLAMMLSRAYDLRDALALPDDPDPAQPDLCPVCESACPTHRNVDPRHGDPSETPPVCVDGWHNRRTSGGVPLSIDEFIGRPTFVAFARDVGRELGAAAATAWLSLLDDATPDDPVTVAERRVLQLVMPWSEVAAQRPRKAGDPDANLLDAVKELRLRLKQAEEAEER